MQDDRFGGFIVQNLESLGCVRKSVYPSNCSHRRRDGLTVGEDPKAARGPVQPVATSSRPNYTPGSIDQTLNQVVQTSVEARSGLK